MRRAASGLVIAKSRWLVGFLACPMAPAKRCISASRLGHDECLVAERVGLGMERLAPLRNASTSVALANPTRPKQRHDLFSKQRRQELARQDALDVLDSSPIRRDFEHLKLTRSIAILS